MSSAAAAFTETVPAARHTSMLPDASALIPQGMSRVNQLPLCILGLASGSLRRFAFARTCRPTTRSSTNANVHGVDAEMARLGVVERRPGSADGRTSFATVTGRARRPCDERGPTIFGASESARSISSRRRKSARWAPFLSGLPKPETNSDHQRLAETTLRGGHLRGGLQYERPGSFPGVVETTGCQAARTPQSSRSDPCETL